MAYGLNQHPISSTLPGPAISRILRDPMLHAALVPYLNGS